MQPVQSLSSVHVPTCLIVEDSVFDSERMRRVLTRCRYGLAVEIAPTLACARAVLARRDAALILLDNRLPDGLGSNFALELSRDKNLSHIPVILVSDWPSPFMWEKAASAGVRYVVNKQEFDTRYVHDALRAGALRQSVH